MKNIVFLFIITFSYNNAFAHSIIKGRVLNTKNNEPITNVFIQIKEANKLSISDVNGAFEFKGLAPGSYTLEFSLLGFKKEKRSIQIKDDESTFLSIMLEEAVLQFSEILVTPRRELGLNTISAIDINLRLQNNTQDLLRLVPGLFIAQHAGGGKAEQIFLRGFDVDHGTDVALSVDGMPVNMVSHAHGQGYADLHFVIPETIDGLSFAKGPYDAKVGDFNTAGAVQFQTKRSISQSLVKLEAGSFNTMRGLVMLNLLDNQEDTTNRKHNAYIASEYFLTRGFFDTPQNFKRLNVFGKYSGKVSDQTNLSLSLSAFSSNWDASGQIPERAIASGMITRWGSIDNTEGGNTSRYNANAILTKTLDNEAIFKNQLFYSRYNFSLFSNFTFFNRDSLNGDQIHQYETRDILGYNGSYSKNITIGHLETRTIVGVGLRNDMINNIGLSNTFRRQYLSDTKKGDVDEINANAYIEESFFISPRFTITAGARLDHFRFSYVNKLTDSLASVVSKSLVSPKLNMYYSVFKNVQFYVSAGTGFHSNDARVVVGDANANTVPRAFGADLGGNFKILNKLFVNAALWFLDLESEFVYVGDEGVIEPSGKSRRIGLDVSVRYQIYKWLYADVDFNITKPRFVEEREGSDYIPLAPTITSIGGLSIKSPKGFNASLRYRYLGDRPAIEDNSINAKGYFILEAVLNYQKERFSFNLSAENLLNSKWNEAQFATESRLKGEQDPVNEIHFTPGTPLFIKAGITMEF